MTIPTDPTTPIASRAAPDALEAVSGIQLMQGIGQRPAQGFWTEAWSQVVRRPGAILGLTWLAVVGFFAVFAPVIATGHPIVLRERGPGGSANRISSPLLEHLTAGDALLLAGTIAGAVLLLPPWRGWARSARLGFLVLAIVHGGFIVAIAAMLHGLAKGAGAGEALRAAGRAGWFPLVASGVPALLGVATLWIFPFAERVLARIALLALAAAATVAMVLATWNPPLENFDYRVRQARAEIEATFAPVPFSPTQGSTSLDLRKPGSTPMSAVIDAVIADAARARGIGGFSDDPRWQVRRQADAPAMRDAAIDDAIVASLGAHLANNRAILPHPPEEMLRRFEASRAEIGSLAGLVQWLEDASRTSFHLGTDSNGRDVLSQMLHACRLSISIGLVSTGIAVIIGVTMGALMGYFGGWVDLLLYRVVEVFMAIPVLFLLIVAAGVLPRNTYVMMIIIGCVTWTGAARFIRAEFYKLRSQDFVQSARSVGLPLRSILFKHMLPNGVTPVLVESSFAIAAAILAEATLSYLGLGPANQASWGRLLSDATNQVGDFVWWLAIFPGGAIFLTVLSYNLIGEALRDAIDPKLKKARV